jgi:hypothetical protein
MRSSLVRAAALGLAALFAAAACSQPPTDEPSTDVTSTAPADGTVASKEPSCALAPPSLIKSALGLDVGAPTSATNPPVVGCTYPGERSVIVRFQSGEDASSFTRGRQGFERTGQPTTDVAGFQDQAYTASTEFGDIVSTTLVARRGPVEILVTSTATLDQEKALLTTLFTALA